MGNTMTGFWELLGGSFGPNAVVLGKTTAERPRADERAFATKQSRCPGTQVLLVQGRGTTLS